MMFRKNGLLSKKDIFYSGKLNDNLANKTLRSGMFTFASQGIMFGINTTGTIILARLLSPSDYGIVGMALVVVSFAKMFMEAGLSTATVQAKEIYHEQLSALFWTNTAIGILLGCIVLASAPLLALFYRQPELLSVTALLSITFFVSGLGVQHMAILRRHMKFGMLAVISMVSDIAMVTTTIALALAGLRYWAIITGLIVMSITKTCGMFYFCRWIPGSFKRGTGLRLALQFGRNLTVANFFIYVSRSIDGVLIGRFLGAGALGIYQKAYHLFMMPINEIRGPLTNVSISALSALRNDPERYKKYFLRIVDLLATAALPITLYCLLEADFIIELLLGQQWLGVIPVFRILALAGFIVPVAGTVGIVLLSLGQSKKYLIMQSVHMFGIILGISVGVLFGLKGIAYGFVTITYLLFIPQLVYAFHKTPIPVAGFLKSLAMPAVTASTAATIAKTLVMISPSPAGWSSYLFLVLFWLILISLSYMRKPVRETVAMAVQKISIRKQSNSTGQTDYPAVDNVTGKSH